MKRTLLILFILCGFFYADAQIYQNIPGYGFKWQRVSPDSVLHLPSSSDTTLRTSYSTLPQIRRIGDSLWFYNGARWYNASRGIDSAVLLTQVVRTFGAQNVSGTKTFLDSAVFNKPFAAFNSMALFGTGAATVRIGYGANIGESQIKLGDSFIFKRVGTSDPVIQSVAKNLLVYSNGLQVYGDSVSGTYAPGKLRLAGNFGFDVAKFGAYNSAVSTLYFGNESTTAGTYVNEMNIYGRNNRWMINDTSTVPTYQASSIFTLQSTKKGFLLPRMTTTQRDAIASPATGLEVYNTSTNRKNYYNGSTWLPLATTTDLASYVLYTDTAAMLSNYRRTSTLIENSDLRNSTISGIALGSNLNSLTAGNGLVGTAYNGSAAQTWRVDTTGIYGSVARLFGTQEIGGNKSFTNDVVINDITVGRGAGALSSNTRVGNQAFNSNTTGFGNTAIGQTALLGNTVGARNTAIGQSALYTNTSGNENTAVGVAALQLLTTGTGNVGVGYSAMNNVTTGTYNVGVGISTLNAVTSGQYNTALGHGAGSTVTTGSFNTYIGNNAAASGTAVTNEIVIGYSLTGNGSNTVTIGNNSITNNYFNGNLRAGGAILTGALSGTSLSMSGNLGGISLGNTGAANQHYYEVKNSVNVSEHGVLAGGNAYLSSNGNYPLDLYTFGNIRIRITGTGNTLIKTTTDNGDALQVSGRGYFSTGITIGNNDGSYGTFVSASSAPSSYTIASIRNLNSGVGGGVQGAQLNFYGDAGYSSGVPTAFIRVISNDIESSGNGSIVFGTHDGAAGTSTQKLKIDYLGRATFSNKLGVNGAAATYGLTVYNASNGTTAAIGGTTFGIRIDNAGSFGNGGTVIHGTDNTFFGSYQKLSLNGSSLEFMTDYGTKLTIANTGAITATSTVTATGFIVSSDYRYKDIISQDGDLYQYTLKADPTKQIHYGYLAQEVEKTMPFAVSTNADGYKAVNYTEVHAIKIRELEKRIEQLEKLLNK